MAVKTATATDDPYLDGIRAGIRLSLDLAGESNNVASAKMAMGAALAACDRLEDGHPSPVAEIKRAVTVDWGKSYRGTRR